MVHFLTTRPKTDRCPRCRRLRLTGVAEGVPYRVDPAPLVARAELGARLQGRESWWVTGKGLAWRTPERIRADVIRGRPIVFADHACDHPVAALDVDPTYLGFVTRMLSACESGCAWSEYELAVFAALARHLNARVIDSDSVPF